MCLADPIVIQDEYDSEDYDEVISRSSVISQSYHIITVILQSYHIITVIWQVIARLQSNQMTKVVVVFADRIPAGKLLEAAKRRKALDFIWIGSVINNIQSSTSE